MNLTAKRHRRRFAPICQRLEERALLAPVLHAIGSDGHYMQQSNMTAGNFSLADFQIAGQGTVSLNGQLPDHLATPTTPDQRVLNVAVGSEVDVFESILARDPNTTKHYNEMDLAYFQGAPPAFVGQQFIPAPDWANHFDYEIHSTDPAGLVSHGSLVYPSLPTRGMPNSSFNNVNVSIDGEQIVSADPLDTSYTFDTGTYGAKPNLSQVIFTSGAGQATTYDQKMGSDLPYPSTNPGWYDVGFLSFFAGATPGLKHVDIDATYGNGIVDRIVFNLNVVSPQATLNSTLATDSFRWGPFLEQSSLEGGQNPVVEWSAVDWNNFDYNNLDPYPQNGVQRTYQFGGSAPGLYPNRFDGSGTNTTPTPGKFYVVQLATVRPSETDIYDTNTGLTTSWTTESPLDSQGNRSYGLDAYNKQIDAPWAMSGLVDSTVHPASSGAMPVPDANSQPGYNGTTQSFHWDSPKGTIPTTQNLGAGSVQTGRNFLLEGEQYHLDLKTYLVFQATDRSGAFTGIPVALLEKDWSINISMTNVNPVLSWANSYTVEANWEGTATETSGVALTNPQLLRWSYNVPDLVSHPLGSIHAAASIPTSLDPSTPGGQAWTFTGQSGVDPLDGGTYAAYLYGGSWTSSMSQQITTQAATYTVSFNASQYSGYDSSWSPALSFDLVVDGNVVGTYTPTSDQFSQVTSVPMTLTAGTHTIGFQSHTPQNWDWGWLDSVKPYFYNYVKDIQLNGVATPATGDSPSPFTATATKPQVISIPSANRPAKIKIDRASVAPKGGELLNQADKVEFKVDWNRNSWSHH